LMLLHLRIPRRVSPTHHAQGNKVKPGHPPVLGQSNLVTFTPASRAAIQTPAATRAARAFEGGGFLDKT